MKGLLPTPAMAVLLRNTQVMPDSPSRSQFLGRFLRQLVLGHLAAGQARQLRFAAKEHVMRHLARRGPLAHEFAHFLLAQLLARFGNSHRSAERRVGQECVSKCSSRCSQYHTKKKK